MDLICSWILEDTKKRGDIISGDEREDALCREEGKKFVTEVLEDLLLWDTWGHKNQGGKEILSSLARFTEALDIFAREL